jgi:hypothetical protein
MILGDKPLISEVVLSQHCFQQRKVGTLDRATQLRKQILRSREIRRKQKGKNGLYSRDPKIMFSIEIQQDYTGSTEVTALPPSFDWKLKLVLATLLL